VHVPLVTPAFGAKAITTVDQVTYGRAGLNIVCGWNQAEFDLHCVTIKLTNPSLASKLSRLQPGD